MSCIQLPATVGYGNLEMTYMIGYGGVEQPLLDRSLLLSTGFARMLLLGVSMQSGFVGGVIFPMLSIGLIAGVVMHQMYPFIHIGLCVSTFIVAVTGAIVPIPITLTALSASVFYLGKNQHRKYYIAINSNNEYYYCCK